MIETYGLTHIALAVQDLDRSLAFYQAVFGMVEVYRGEDFVQAQTPGSRDVIVFKKDAAKAGQSGGVIHFGFRLTDPALIDKFFSDMFDTKEPVKYTDADVILHLSASPKNTEEVKK